MSQQGVRLRPQAFNQGKCAGVTRHKGVHFCKRQAGQQPADRGVDGAGSLKQTDDAQSQDAIHAENHPEIQEANQAGIVLHVQPNGPEGCFSPAKRLPGRAVQVQISQRAVGQGGVRQFGNIFWTMTEDGYILDAHLMQGAQKPPAAGKVTAIPVNHAWQNQFHGFTSSSRRS